MIRYNNNSLEVERALKILDSTEKEKVLADCLLMTVSEKTVNLIALGRNFV